MSLGFLDSRRERFTDNSRHCGGDLGFQVEQKGSVCVSVKVGSRSRDSCEGERLMRRLAELVELILGTMLNRKSSTFRIHQFPSDAAVCPLFPQLDCDLRCNDGDNQRHGCVRIELQDFLVVDR